MSFDLCLQRFGEGGDDSPKNRELLAELLRAARKAIRGKDPECGIVAREGGDAFDVQLPSGSGEVHADHAVFQLQDLGTLELRLIYAVASAGDMVVIVEGGHYRAILTDPRQRQNLPQDWIAKGEPTPVATSPKQLGQLIRGAFDAHEAYRQKVIHLYDEYGPAYPSPWTVDGDPDMRVVYVQAHPGERYPTQSNRLFSFVRKEFILPLGGLPAGGTMGGFSWCVELPSGELLYGYLSRFDHEGWMRVFKAFATLEGRLIATIEGDQLVVDDGRSFALSECRPARLSEG